MTAFAYLRVSSKDQVKGTSLDKQREICQIIGRNLAIQDIEFYEEPGISGENIKNRPVFCSLLEKIKQGDYDNGVAISFDQDRLTRSNRDWSQITDLLREHNIRLHTSQGIMDFNKKDQRLTANIKGSLSEWHLDTIRELCLDGKRRRALGGEWNGGLVLWGYRYNPALPKGQRLEIDPKVAKLVRTLLVELEHLPFYEIAREMNRKGIPSPMGERWNSSKVYSFFDANRLLKYSGNVRVFYEQNGNGEWRHVPEGIIIKARWPAIITSQERDRLLRKKERWKKTRVYPTKANKLITGLGIASCGYCGCSVGTNSSHKNKNGTLRAYYGCMNRCCPQKPNFRMQAIDSLIMEAMKSVDVQKVIQAYSYLTRIRRDQTSGTALRRLNEQISQVVIQRNTLIEKISLNVIRDEEVAPVMKQLRQRLFQLEQEKEELTKQATDKLLTMKEFMRLRTVFAHFDRLPLEQKKLGLKGLLKGMKFFKDRIEIEFNFPVNKKGETELTCSPG